MTYYPINEDTAKRANDANSFRDYKPGSATAAYRAEVDKAAALVEKQKAKVDPMHHDKLDGLLDRYAHRLADYYNDYYRNEAACPSILITGGANFPVAKKEKQNARRDTLAHEYADIQGLLRKIESVGMGGISADDPNAIEKLEEKLARLERTQQTMKDINAYYRKHGTKDNGSDTIYERSANYLGTAPEVVTNNNIRYTPSAEIKAMADAGEPVVVSPAGYNVKIDMPINDILNRFTKLETEGQIVLNTVTLTVPVTEIANSAGIAPPQYMLLVKASDKDKFFANSTLPDNKTSFYTEYNKTTKTYSFTGLRPYVKSVLDGEFAGEDGIEDFYLIPVDATFIQSRDYLGNIKKTLTDMIPQLSTPAMAEIGKPKIVATFSKKNYSK